MYTQTLVLGAARERVFDTIATVDGVRRWWTPLASGSGSDLVLEFAGLDERIVMRVEAERPSRVRWSCVQHTSAPAWDGTAIGFELGEPSPGACEVSFRHDGIVPALVADGWRRFLASLAAEAEQGAGEPFGPHGALAVARAYHRAWTSNDFARAGSFLARDLHTDVPINTYADADEFLGAVTRFSEVIDSVDVLAEFEHADEALLLYDLVGAPFGTLRVAEHFTVADGRIARIRHVHDTAALTA
jgi:hypothetical protein